jgi:hypothetical protein
MREVARYRAAGTPFRKESPNQKGSLGLSVAAGGAIYLSSGEAGVARRQLDIN